MRRREISTALIAAATGAALLPKRAEATTCAPLCYPHTAAELTQPTKVINPEFPPGHVYRYGTTPDANGLTYALQAALDLNEVVELPAGEISFTHLTWKFRRTIRGKGPRWSVLKQISTVNRATPAITFEAGNSPVVAPLVPPGTPGDISEGAYRADGFCVTVASDVGLYAGSGSQASMFLTDQFRLVSQEVANHFQPPYPTRYGQTGIKIAANFSTSAFVANHRNLEIRGFDVGIEASGGVNEWKIHGWFLDCRVAVRLNSCSTWSLDGLSIESGVTNARALQLIYSIANISVIGGRWELTQSGAYGIEGDGSVTGGNIRIRGVNVLIAGDNGTAIPGRKWSGVLPGDTIFEGSDVSGPFIVVPNLVAVRLPNSLKLGGQTLGNGKIVLGRNAGGAVSTIEEDGTTFRIAGAGSVKVFGEGATTERLEITASRVILGGADGANGHQSALRLGASSYLWVDSSGRLRIKTGAPGTNTDGVVVGSQT